MALIMPMIQNVVKSRANGRQISTSCPSTLNSGSACHSVAVGSGLVKTSMKMMWTMATSAPRSWMSSCAQGGRS